MAGMAAVHLTETTECPKEIATKVAIPVKKRGHTGVIQRSRLSFLLDVNRWTFG